MPAPELVAPRPSASRPVAARRLASAVRRAAPLPASRAPARPALAVVARATLGGSVSLVLLVAVGTLLGHPVLIPPLAASAALVFAAPTLPLAQPRSVIGGQLVSAVVGFLTLAVAGGSAWAAAVAGGLAIGAMALTRTAHSPAAATAVIVVMTQPAATTFLLLLLLATVLITGTGFLAARAGGRSGKGGPGAAPYPAYWW
ncbi:HPP family protein [Streptomyces sp. NPDC017520]|uniref:HPP family protein n=1 Tax=Streptomyces sp. NPDC017520 TaxID=3364998 RepID=UPI00379086D9